MIIVAYNSKIKTPVVTAHIRAELFVLSSLKLQMKYSGMATSQRGNFRATSSGIRGPINIFSAGMPEIEVNRNKLTFFLPGRDSSNDHVAPICSITREELFPIVNAFRKIGATR